MHSLHNPVLVLAAGDQTRWNATDHKDVPAIKQLCKIGDETLIQRIERQFPDAIVFTNNNEITDNSSRPYPVEDNTTIISSLFSTRAHWRVTTTILLGDVMYSRAMVKRLARQKEPIMFYGDHSEIYAIKFKKEVRDLFARSIMELVKHPTWTVKYGKLWNLYRFINGIDFTKHEIGPMFIRIGDCRDFDTKEEYLNYVK